MLNRKLLRAQIKLERFLKRVARKNDPLEAYRGTEPFKNFQENTKAIITAQAKYAAQNLGEIPIWDNENLSADQIEAHVSRWLDAKMPQFSEKMDQETAHALLLNAWVWSIKAQYERMGAKVLAKAADYTVNFDLTNQGYLDSIMNDAAYLLNIKSKSYDQTTKDALIRMVRAGRLNRDTIDDIASDIEANFDGISSVRAFMISNTETANAFGNANEAFMSENDIAEKEWVTAGGNPCQLCQDNEDAGPIPSDSDFPSGDSSEPAHPSCECYTQGVGQDLSSMSNSELDSLVLWDGS